MDSDFPDHVKSIFSEKGGEFDKKKKKIGHLYEEWFPSHPSYIDAHGDVCCYEFLKLLSSKFSPKTLMLKFSYLKSYLDLKYSISNDFKLTMEYLKKINKSHHPERAHVFEIHGTQGIINYWKLEPENDQTLLFQVMSMTAVFASHHRCEVSSMLVSDINIVPEKNYVDIMSSHSKGTKRLQSHVIPSTEDFNSVKLFQLYLE